MLIEQLPTVLMAGGAAAAFIARTGSMPIRAALGGAVLAGSAALLLAFTAANGDALGTSLSLLTCFIVAVVLGFSARHMRADPRRATFAWRIAMLGATVLGFVSAQDLVTLALCWVASGLLLAELIGHSRDWSDAREAASRARLAFLAGDLGMLGAFTLLAWHAGDTRLTTVLASAGDLSGANATLVGLLLLIAAAARCGLPPFSRWLLRSLTAPTPVSAVMHAGLVNAGGFLLIRFAPVLEAAPLARWAAVITGFVAAIYGVAVMMVRPDVKRGLSASTVAQMGFMVLTCGFGAYAAAAWHLVAHGLFKAWAFLGAGSVMGRPSAPALSATPTMVTAAASVTALSCLALLVSGPAAADLLPHLLAGATLLAIGAAALASTYRSALLPPLAAAAVVNIVALAALGRALPAATVPLPGAAAGAAGLLLTFLGFWLWQARGGPIPAQLYARLATA